MSVCVCVHVCVCVRDGKNLYKKCVVKRRMLKSLPVPQI